MNFGLIRRVKKTERFKGRWKTLLSWAERLPFQLITLKLLLRRPAKPTVRKLTQYGDRKVAGRLKNRVFVLLDAQIIIEDLLK